ncbi:P-loop containing nucleoside triphosphate hydrolase protein [Basidiobolus meristosporus CBS 931.73]|uniref:DNA 3'-5' helicase n=1 Tax=Basidiobolus meristosporus CBS 931.73 TaxID=1314790 RepID=A0A1Y1Y7H5_9FUNG|nr:P-loop containing nucleoside triphosphate hydrolase protein [Basidiobolus meristosporus CBS 931.73]|eukprot:ORX93962.1 P-loop containing nucleoside triphosphate hydrolase protein [Basidiobolus meristosporus CBS 931.73]
MVSLMQDQVRCLPPELPGACLTSMQESSEQKKIIKRIFANEIRILFISPEKLQSENFQNLLKADRFPRILLACVDEAHCLSEWSHNFRPSYLKVNLTLKEKLKVPCILAMTGTATHSTKSSICEMLEIHPTTGVISGPLIRANLKLSVSVETNRETALINLLNSEPFRGLNSIIIYVMRQNQADLLASQLRVRNFQADSYHAGKSASQRKTAQTNFMTGKLRILVATIAFGLGLNKLDVRSVIHFNLPKSMENYVQEIGRSGRDGLPSYCHMFVDQEDFTKLRSLAYSDSVDEIAIRRLLFKVFPNSVKTEESREEGENMAAGRTLSRPLQLCLSMDGLEADLDIKREVIETLLSYMNMFPDPPLRMLPSTFAKCNLGFYKPPTEKLFQEFPCLETIIKQSKKTRTSYVFEPIKICEMLDISFEDLRGQLYRLQRRKEGYFELIEPSFYLELLKFPFKQDVDDEFIDSLKVELFSRSKFQELTKLMQVDQVYNIMTSIATQDHLKASYATVDETGERMGPLRIQHSEQLQKSIGQYFSESTQLIQSQAGHPPQYTPPATIQELIAGLTENDSTVLYHLQNFLAHQSEFIASARAVTRIFHGIPSPQYTTTQWCRSACWGKFVDFNFDTLMRLAQKVLLENQLKGFV